MKSLTALLFALLLVATACASDDDSSSEASSDDATTESSGDDDDGEDGADEGPAVDSITLVAYDSYPADDLDEPNPLQIALDEFTAETGVEVEILNAGDTGTMLAKAELTAGNPEGDVIWGIDNSFLSRAIDAEIFEPYAANGLDAIDPAFLELVPNHEATPVDFGDVCVNYDIAAVEGAGLDAPASFEDLAANADQLVVQNPGTSSPGLAFLLATIAEFGEDGWEDYWTELAEGGVSVTDGWTDAYYGEFTWAGGGDRSLVVSYGSSPPFEVLFAAEPLDAAPTGVVEATCFRQIEFAGVLAGTDAPSEAQALIDFLISERFQTEIPMNLFVFPANQDVELAPEFVDFATIPESSLSLDPATIAENRADWIDRWTEIVAG